MRDRVFLDFVRDRVMADIAARPSVRPYLGETAPPVETCPSGHSGFWSVQGTAYPKRVCLECRRLMQIKRLRRRRQDHDDPMHAPSQGGIS